MICVTAVFGASAAGNGVVCKASSESVNAGETAIFTVALSCADPFKSMGLSLEYDKDVFELISGSWLLTDAVIADCDKSNGNAAVAFSSEVTENGDIFEFVLKAKDTVAEGKYKVEVTPIIKNGSDTVEAFGGSVEISVKSSGTETLPIPETEVESNISTPENIGEQVGTDGSSEKPDSSENSTVIAVIVIAAVVLAALSLFCFLRKNVTEPASNEAR